MMEEIKWKIEKRRSRSRKRRKRRRRMRRMKEQNGGRREGK
jgi:hypothetical protein